MVEVTAVIVNYNSGSDCARLLRQLDRQQGVRLDAVVINSGSDDGSLVEARDVAGSLSMSVRFIEPGRNVGYTGNNLVLREADHDIFIVNPDVRITDPELVARLAAILEDSSNCAAVAPNIIVNGRLEYAESVLDLEHALAYHTQNTVAEWPHPTATHEIAWLNGAAWLLRCGALEDVGPLDERFFLFFEEVDWCIRARQSGWRLLLSGELSVGHHRSSSFAGTQKGAYYHWRNLYLLCSKHANGWEGPFLRRLLSENLRRSAISTGASRRALGGYLDARRGRFGPSPEDQ